MLLGYPPFVKDVIDAGAAEGIGWASFRPKLVFAGEVFSEEWRSLIGLRRRSGNCLELCCVLLQTLSISGLG